MAIDLTSITKGASHLPPRILIYGVHGVGKSTLASTAPAPIFLQTEDGLGLLDTPRFPLAKTFTDVLEALMVMATQDHEFKTLIVDSVDWLEPLIWAHICAEHGHKSIEDFGYGKGYALALDGWREYLDAINYIRNEKNMTIIQLAHTEVKRFDDPTNEPYDRYQIKLHKAASAKVQEHSDIVLFANYRVNTINADVGMNKKKARAVGAGERLVFTEERPAFVAKNRYGMPGELPMDWSEIAKTIPFYNGEDNGAA
jgi:hypothetical protein